MYRYLSILLFSLLLVACSKAQAPADMTGGVAETAQKSTARFLAYHHSVELAIEEAQIAATVDNLLKTCRQAQAAQCVILKSEIQSGRFAYARVELRAKPAGIQQLLAALRMQGEVRNQSTTAEDLSAPIQDNAKKLAMLTDYREKLEGLRTRANQDVDALIKVNRELAQVQSELEALRGTQAGLEQRVDTELLSVAISAQAQGSFWKPIQLALSDFGENLSHGLSSVITALAYMLPWSALLLLVGWVLRFFWRRRRRST